MPALAVARASRSYSPGWRMRKGCTAPQGGAIRIPPVVLPRHGRAASGDFIPTIVAPAPLFHLASFHVTSFRTARRLAAPALLSIDVGLPLLC
jgi:hypothetical protein